MRERLFLAVTALLCFGLLAGGCKEKKQMTVREVKEDAVKTEIPPGAVFARSKVISGEDAGHVDIVDPEKATLNEKIHVGGWAVDRQKKMPAKAVVTLVDGKQVAVPFRMGLSRGDVAKTLKDDALVESGWDGELDARALGKGKHKVEFFAVVAEGKFAPLTYKDRSFCEITVTE